MKPVSASPAVRFVVGLVPYAVSAILQQREQEDRRPCKYFLPYAIMCRRMLAVYGIDVWNYEKDRGIVGIARAICPYGLVLWWDREDARLDAELQISSRRAADDRAASSVKISVVIPVYNASRHLAECLNSVTGQTFREIEVICVDDGSSDGSLEILRKCAASDRRVRVMTQRNRYAGVARNTGLAAARGEYIHFLDADDWIDATTYEQLYATAKSAGADMVKFRSYSYDNATGKVFNSYFTDMGGVPQSCYGRCISFKDQYRSLVACSDAPWSGLYKRDFISRNGIKFDTLKCGNDTSFFYRCILAAKSIYLTKDRFVYYRRNLGKSLVGIRPYNFDCQLRQYYIIDGFLRDVEPEAAQTIRRHLLDAIFYRFGRYIEDGALPPDAKEKIEFETADFLATVPESLIDERHLATYRALVASAPPSVSVVIPVYNCAEHLDECLCSVRRQTLTNIEVICVDDRSTDGSLDIIRRHAAEDPRIKVVAKEANTGAPGICKNIGIAASAGRYIGVVDADDHVADDYFRLLLCAAWRENADVAATSAVSFDTDGVISPSAMHEIKPGVLETPSQKAGLMRFSGSNWNKIYRRAMLSRYAIMCCEIPRLAPEDNQLSMEAVCAANRVAVIDDARYIYRKHAGTLTAKPKTEDDFKVLDVYGEIERFVMSRWAAGTVRDGLLAAVRIREAVDFGWIRNSMDRGTAKKFDSLLKAHFPWALAKIGASGIDHINRDIVVSLTSWPGRISTVDQVVKSILAQSFKVDKIVLWLAASQFPCGEAELPANLLGLRSSRFEIRWCEDLRSYKKLIPALKAFPDAILITVDDDNIYGRDCIRKLLEEHVNHTEDVICHRVTRVMPNIDGTFRVLAGGKSYYRGASFLNKLVGLGGVLYPPGSLGKEVEDAHLALSLAPTNDDLWFWCHAALAGHGVRVAGNAELEAHYIKGTQNVGLFQSNDRGERLFWKDFNRLLEHYPRFHEILLKDWQERPDEWNDNMAFYRESIEHWCRRWRKMDARLDDPRTFNEKTQWLKLYDSTPEKSRLADKYIVREWVKQKIGAQYLIPLLGVYDSPECIDFDGLPSRFVLKCNHGCAYNIIVKDKSRLDVDEARGLLRRWLSEDYGSKHGMELHYKNIKPRIIAEKFMGEDEDDGDLPDYKFWCFGGKCFYIQFLSERQKHLKMVFFDRDWNVMPFVYDHIPNKNPPPKPENLQEMLAIAEKLSPGFPFVRVDLYRLRSGKIYFGEMTFTSAAGGGRWSDEKANRTIGGLITLPTIAYNVDTGLYFDPSTQLH